jgi:hypothetical protein
MKEAAAAFKQEHSVKVTVTAVMQPGNPRRIGKTGIAR